LKTDEAVAMTDTRINTRNISTLSGVNMISMNIFSKTSGFRMTNHAVEISQQRCIPPLIIHWLCQYGSRKRNNNGRIVCYFDKKSVRLLASDVGHVVVQRLSGLMNSYLVITGNQIISVGHHYKRIKNI